MKYVSKKGTTINIPDGLSPQQIKAIKADADSGYGTRAQQTADSLGKKLVAQPAAPKTLEEQKARTEAEIAKRKGETPNLTARLNDINAQLGTQNPTNPTSNPANPAPTPVVNPGGDQGDYFPNKAGGKDGTKDNVTADPDTVINSIKQTPGMEDLQGNIEKARQGMYQYLTRDFEANKARELEAAKQEMADRGIPYSPDAVYDPNTKDLYGRTVGAINRGYDDRYSQASAQAFADSLGQGTTAFNAAVGATGQANSDLIGTLLQLNDQELKKMGLNRDFLIAQKQLKQGDKDLAIKQQAVNKAGSGGGGGGGGSQQQGGGFQLIE